MRADIENFRWHDLRYTGGVATSRHSDDLPELLDMRLMGMSPQAFTLNRMERLVGVEYAQLARQRWDGAQVTKLRNSLLVDH